MYNMSVVNISKINLHDIVVKSPVKKNDQYYSGISLKQKKMFIQFSNVTIQDLSNFTVKLSNKQCNSMIQLERYFIQKLSENSKSWFNTNLTENQINDNYLTTMQGNSLKLHTKNVRTFDGDQNEIDFNTLKCGNNVTIIVHFSGLKFWSTKITNQLELLQIKRNINLSTDILFIDEDTEEEYTSGEDEGMYHRRNS